MSDRRNATQTRWRLGSAPISYGIYGGMRLPDGGVDRYLSDVVEAGYAGTELGPPGLMGNLGLVQERLSQASLSCLGAYVPLHLGGSDDEFHTDMQSMLQTLEELNACGASLAILADEGSEHLLANPVHAAELGLDAAGWSLLFDRLDLAVSRVNAAGLKSSFHPHVSTFVESPKEIRKLLEGSDISLTFDTGHIFLAGGDVVALAAEWADRISHVHIKDVRSDVMRAAIAEGRADFNAWWVDVCVELGSGDVDLDGFLRQLAKSDYAGWLVVEQDAGPVSMANWAEVSQSQQGNLKWLESRVSGL